MIASLAVDNSDEDTAIDMADGHACDVKIPQTSERLVDRWGHSSPPVHTPKDNAISCLEMTRVKIIQSSTLYTVV